MTKDLQLDQDFNIALQDFAEGVTYDPDTIVIQAVYRDELSAHRAKKLWVNTLINFFQLSSENDFTCTVMELNEFDAYYLSCTFLSPNGRYAFWRITNYQAPEAQYIFETAHIPICESRHSDILTAPDLRSIYDERTFKNLSSCTNETKNAISNAFKKILDAVLKG